MVGTGRKDSLEENAKTIITESGKLRSQLTFRNMLPQFILYLSMMAIYWWISSVYDGEVVALLPFEPFGFFRGVTHRGVEGDNYYHCAVVSGCIDLVPRARYCCNSVQKPLNVVFVVQAGIFAMSSMGLRAAFSKIIGHKQPGGGSSSPSLFDMSSFQQQIEDAQNSRRLKTQRRK